MVIGEPGDALHDRRSECDMLERLLEATAPRMCAARPPTSVVEIGDSDLPVAPYSGGSAMALSLSGAIEEAVGDLVRAFLDVVADDEYSPLRGSSPGQVTTTNGGIHLLDAPSVGETYLDTLARHGLREITADGQRDPRANGASPPLG